MAVENPQTEPKKKSKRFYIILAATILLLALLVGVVIFELSNVGQTTYGPGPVGIEVITDKPVYLLGEGVNFTVYVNNPQNWSVPYPNSILAAVEKDGVEVTALGGGQIEYAGIPTFPPHSKTLVFADLIWYQTKFVNGTRLQVHPGNYTYTVSFEGRVNYGPSGNCTFEIR